VSEQATVQAWMDQPYAIRVRKLRPDEGRGYMASIPQLGEWTYTGVGDTYAEAIEDLGLCQRHLFELLVEDGKEPPEPLAEPEGSWPEEWPSGQFGVRIPRDLHAQLRAQADAANVSLNTYVISLLAQGVAKDEQFARLRDLLAGQGDGSGAAAAPTTHSAAADGVGSVATEPELLWAA